MFWHAGWGNIMHYMGMDILRFVAQEMEVDNATYLLVLMVDAMVKIMLVSAIHRNRLGAALHLHLIPSDLTGNLLF